MKVTAWNNGKKHSSGAGYGLKIEQADRDSFFKKKWKNVHLSLPEQKQAISINIDKPSFWNDTCRELIHKDIGRWLIAAGHAPWPRGKPPKLELVAIRENHFKVKPAKEQGIK